jgi:hypothetical protein
MIVTRTFTELSYSVMKAGRTAIIAGKGAHDAAFRLLIRLHDQNLQSRRPR